MKRYASRTMRGKIKVHKGYSRHHRKPQSLGGGNEDENISVVPCYQHQAWHDLFSNFDPETIAKIINQKWLDTSFKFMCVRVK
jgi:hypothetical protein